MLKHFTPVLFSFFELLSLQASTTEAKQQFTVTHIMLERLQSEDLPSLSEYPSAADQNDTNYRGGDITS